MKIISARRSDAGFIAECIMDAVGEEICLNLAGEKRTLDDVKTLFASLAERDDTQYSYKNTLVAVDENDDVMGAIIGYDGAGLHEMRTHFFTAARNILGIDMTNVEDECDADEFYLDTLAVRPKHRNKGVATGLLNAMIDRARSFGKPAGLLVEKNNDRARRLYESVGFRKVGDRPFAYVLMDHLRK